MTWQELIYKLISEHTIGAGTCAFGVYLIAQTLASRLDLRVLLDKRKPPVEEMEPDE